MRAAADRVEALEKQTSSAVEANIFRSPDGKIQQFLLVRQ
jgi:hypothetical protein